MYEIGICLAAIIVLRGASDAGRRKKKSRLAGRLFLNKVL
jgi:hypothetical protein